MAVTSDNSFIVITELDDSFPRRDPTKPPIYIGISKSPPATRFEVFQKGKGPKAFMGHHVRLREDLSGDVSSSSEGKQVKKDKAKLVKSLKEQGFAVNGDARVWCVYVVDLDATDIKDVGLGYIYVGQSAHTPEERYVQHKASKPTDGTSDLASRIVRKLGLRVNQQLTLQELFLTREAALKKEKAYANELCRVGYLVEAGHVTPDPKTCKTKEPKQKENDE